MKQNRIIYLGIIIVIAIFALIKLSKKDNVATVPVGVTTPTEGSPVEQRLQNTTIRTGSDNRPAMGFLEGVIEKYSIGRMLSDKTKEDFKKQAKVQLKFPDNYRFHSLDMEFDQITGIYATSPSMNVAVLAGRVLPTDAQVKSFLKDKDNGIPNTDGKNVTLIGEPVIVPPLSNTGLKSGKYWEGRTASGEGVRVGLVQRADGKGSYMFIFTGKEDKLDNSEDFFEGLYKDLKATPE